MSSRVAGIHKIPSDGLIGQEVLTREGLRVLAPLLKVNCVSQKCFFLRAAKTCRAGVFWPVQALEAPFARWNRAKACGEAAPNCFCIPVYNGPPPDLYWLWRIARLRG